MDAEGVTGPTLLACFQAVPSLSRGERLQHEWVLLAKSCKVRQLPPRTFHKTRRGQRELSFCSLNANHFRDCPNPTCCKEFTRHGPLIFVALPCMFLKFLECTQGGKLLDKDTINIQINKYIQTSGTLIKHQSFITCEGGGVGGGH